MLFMSRRQLAHVFETADFAKPVRGPKGYYMAAAFRHAHRDFRLLRERTLIPRHFVVHQDSWLARNMTRIPFTKALRAQLCIAFGSRAPI
jgi:hypothetical protein